MLLDVRTYLLEGGMASTAICRHPTPLYSKGK